MPGAGKSTIGVLLAKELGLNFVDTDVVIQVQQHETLQAILEREGYLRLREIEESTILAQNVSESVVATGGSAVYGNDAMAYLKSAARIVFIDVPLEVLERRITNYGSRGIARAPGQSFDTLFAERKHLYQSYADVTVQGGELSPGELVDRIIELL